MTPNPVSGSPKPFSKRLYRHERIGAMMEESVPVEQATAPWLLVLFIVSIVPPIYFHIGDTRLSLTRIFLLLTFLPLGFRLLSGKVGRLRTIDIFLILLSTWMAITIIFHEGFSRTPLAGMSVIELLGGYLVGRTLIVNSTDYRLFIRYLIFVQLFLLPFALLEFVTNKNLLHDLFGIIFNTFEKPPSQTWRNGFARVISGFEHPILFGLFCSIMVAPFFYIYRSNLIKATGLAALPLFMTYLSLSSAPIIGAGICVLLIAWGEITKSSWKPLIWMICLIYIFLSLASNRGPIVILIDTLTFSAHTGWTRIWTFRYGSAEVLRNPFFGIGFNNNWIRPTWLTGSVDNFWLLVAMRHGLIGIILLILALGGGLWAILRAKNLNPTLSFWRTGYVISLVGLYFSLTTVHIWGDTSSFIMCFIGSGMWLCTAGGAAAAPMKPDLRMQKENIRSLPTTRFANTAPTSTKLT